MDRRLHLLWGVPLLLLTVGTVWSGLGLPAARLVLKYGPTPGCEPTGKVEELEGVKFVEIGRGIARIGSPYWLDREGSDQTAGDLVGRMASRIGLDWGKAPALGDEMPVHWVEFPRGIVLAETEITNAQYERFDSKHERSETFDKDDSPVVNVSWDDAKAYCEWLSERTGHRVRLPSESEWEACCRAGSRTEYAFGDDEAGLSEYAWYGENAKDGALPVGTKKPNAWGFYDLHGNVWEWCADWYHPSYLVERQTKNARGELVTEVLGQAPTDGTAWLWQGGSGYRVFRGGSWFLGGWVCRSARRGWLVPGGRGYVLGFRPALGN